MKSRKRAIRVLRVNGALALAGFIAFAGAVIALQVADWPLRSGRPITIEAPGDDWLRGMLYPGRREAGIILLEGFGSDQAALRAPTRAFQRTGAHVMTFDFSGHGQSPGALGFDNAATDRLARQVLAAIELLQVQTGLPTSRIVLWGHSMGARVALQASTIGQQRFAGLILVGAQVNLAANVQSELFTGVRDIDLAWVQALGPANPPTDVLLITGRWDDVLTPEAARLLLRHLAADPVAVDGVAYRRSGGSRELCLIPALLHIYEVFSPRALNPAIAWAMDRWGFDMTTPVVGYGRIAAWAVGLVGLFMLLHGASSWHAARARRLLAAPAAWRIVRARRFYLAKLLLWLPALPVAALLGGLSFVLPIGFPAFNLIYVGFIGAYGLLVTLLYRVGRMPGVERLLGGETDQRAPEVRGAMLQGVLLSVALLLLTAAYARTGWFTVPPAGDRLLWLLIFTPVTALGFWIGALENSIEDAHPWALTLINLAPFLLWAVFQLAIGSTSGLMSSVHGLIILALAIFSGRLVQRVTARAWIAALIQAVLLYWLILPQGVLFAV